MRAPALYNKVFQWQITRVPPLRMMDIQNKHNFPDLYFANHLRTVLSKTVLWLYTAQILRTIGLPFLHFLNKKSIIWEKLTFRLSILRIALKWKVCAAPIQMRIFQSNPKRQDIHISVIQDYALLVVAK